MDRDKMREEIENWFMENVDCEDDHFFPRDKARYFTSSLLSLHTIAEIRKKARKWDKIQEISTSDYCSRCFNHFKCPSDDYAPCPFKDIIEEVDALEVEVPDGN